jgi:molybdopterin molybdotransferase
MLPAMAGDAGISVWDAIARLRTELERLPTETIDVSAAHGRVLAADIVARADLPGSADSALDGIACRVADTLEATAAAPVALRLVGDAAAGGPFGGRVGPNEAVHVHTGALMPDGADGVVPVERLTVVDDVVHVQRPASPRDVRRRGEALRAGAVVLAAGRRLDASALALAHAAGAARVVVAGAPRVVVLTTGDELRSVETVSLRPDERFDSNGPGLAALLREANATVVRVERVRDDREITRARLDAAVADADLVVTSGGVSMGMHDHVRALLQTEGDVVFWRVAMKPGGPMLFGRWRGTPLLGLPGNPVSSFVTFHVLARPALQALEGDRAPAPLEASWPARAGTALRGTKGKVHFARVHLERDETGWRAVAYGDQGSGVLASAAAADALAVVPADVDLAAGDPVDVLPWRLTPLTARAR